MTTPRPLPAVNELAEHAPWMRRLARGLVGDAAADDVVQEAWIHAGAVLGGGSSAEPGAPGAPIRSREGYPAAVVRSLALRWRRSELRRARHEQVAARPEALPSAADVAARLEVARRVAQALEALDEPYRTTLVLRYHDELSSAEIARRAGIPAATVRARLKRGLDTLRARLDEQHGSRESWALVLLPLARTQTSSVAASGAGLFLTSLLAMKLTLFSVLVVAVASLAWSLVGGAGSSTPPGPQLALPERAQSSVAAVPNEPLPAPEMPREVALAPATAHAAEEPVPTSAHIAARAVTWDGLPVRGAWLSLRDVARPLASGDDQGELALSLPVAELERAAGTRPDRSLRIEVGAEGFATELVERRLADQANLLELGDVVLEPGAAVHGRVVDPSGVGIEGALVQFNASFGGEASAETLLKRGLPRELDRHFGSVPEPLVAGSSGPGGAFRLTGLPVGHGRLFARTQASLWTFGDTIGLTAGADLPVADLVLIETPEHVMGGVVLDPDGVPLPGFTLRCYPFGNKSWEEAVTGADGRFHHGPWNGALGKPWTLVATSPSWEWENVRLEGATAGMHDLRIQFERSAWLIVAVVDEVGAPIRGGRIEGIGAASDRPLARTGTELDRDGHARLRRPAESLRVHVRAPGYRDALLGPFDPEQFPEPLLVTLEHAPGIVGRVLTADGAPAAGARVSLHLAARGGSGERHVTHQGWRGDGDAFVHVPTATPVRRSPSRARTRTCAAPTSSPSGSATACARSPSSTCSTA